MEELEVNIAFAGEATPVGRLVMADRRILFRYHSSYLATGHNLSPLKLRWTDEIQQPDTTIFGGLFGVFADSLPDGWGRLLLDRRLAELQISLDSINPLDRLAYVGPSGKGALTYRPVNPFTDQQRETRIALKELARQAMRVLADQEVDSLPELLRLGGSSGGARPKVQVLHHAETGELIPDTLPIPKGYSAWIVKFSSSLDGADAAKTEYAYYLAARSARLKMAESRLFKGASGKVYFGTRRFDRGQGNERVHLHSLAGLLHDNFRLPAVDYGHAMDAAFRIERDIHAYQKVLRLAAFNVFTHNRDDHSNNISLLMDAKGNWQLAPAYDLTYSRPAHGEHSITVSGEGRRPTVRHLRELAEHFEVPEAHNIIDEVWEAVRKLPAILSEVGASSSTIKGIRNHLASF